MDVYAWCEVVQNNTIVTPPGLSVFYVDGANGEGIVSRCVGVVGSEVSKVACSGNDRNTGSIGGFNGAIERVRLQSNYSIGQG